jgi:hypothetical protein
MSTRTIGVNTMRVGTTKTSRKYLGGTLAGIGLFIVLIVLYSRFTPLPETAEQAQLPTMEELAALRDFTRIVARGDFVLAVTHSNGFSVDYTTATGEGFLRIDQRGDTLVIEGFGHRADQSDVLRIGMPVLTHLELESLQEVSVSGFNAELLEIDASSHERLRFEDNQFGTLSLEASGVRALELVGNSIGAREFVLHTNDTRISETD